MSAPASLTILTIDDLRTRTTVSLWPEAAGVLGVGRSTAYEAAATGQIPVLRFGRTIRVPTGALLKMLDQPTD